MKRSWEPSVDVAQRQYWLMSRIFALLCALLWAWDVGGIRFLREAGTFLRFQRVDSRVFAGLYRESDATPEIKEFFAPGLAAAGLSRVEGDKARIVFVLKWVMNHVKVAQLDHSTSSIEAYQNAERGAGLSCASMSRIFTDALRSAGFKARRVMLVRSLLNDKDTHVTSEVLVDEHWMVFDPTFNVSYDRNGRLLGVEEIHQSILDGTADTIRPVFYGEVAYPNRLKEYYLDWLALYNNIAIFQEAKGGMYSQLPPFRFWIGPRLDYLESEPTGLWQLRLANQEYFIYVVILPFVSPAVFPPLRVLSAAEPPHSEQGSSRGGNMAGLFGRNPTRSMLTGTQAPSGAIQRNQVHERFQSKSTDLRRAVRRRSTPGVCSRLRARASVTSYASRAFRGRTRRSADRRGGRGRSASSCRGHGARKASPEPRHAGDWKNAVNRGRSRGRHVVILATLR